MSTSPAISSNLKVSEIESYDLQPLTSNEYTSANTFDFVNGIKQLNTEDSTVMTNFDVEPLFTNVALSETT